ncbi:TPA: hypothetical protein V0004_000905 [Streptococcus pneumoniae]|nr:restriction endonuclease R.XbaI [Streptococcus pneumoniae]HEW0723282.1 hypothetical protein [Streptococcus pneumoniae]HEW2870204.1 hypothetical protein [Streptococcus pneumoniae]HEW4218715.1 hypothetical protein [Streptococcus pneumoniae]HEW4485080.1 hypothetical protein [Streptococcus pneumoniae]
MANDNKSHYLIYRVLGISFLEEAAVLSFNEKFGTENT